MSKWISVKDILPENDNIVLVNCIDYIRLAYYSIDEKCWRMAPGDVTQESS